MGRTPTGPWALVGALRDYLASTSWCAWLEVAGSLGRGAGDEASDVDAGAGVSPDGEVSRAAEAALCAALRFGPVAGHLSTPFGRTGTHHAIQYADGRQLSLAVMPATARPGLARGSVAVLDRSGRLTVDFAPSVLRADPDALREWAFLAWWELGDAAKHLRRGSLWRAVTSLEEARRQVWRLLAAREGVDYPLFGAVSVQNADRPVPAWMGESHPVAIEPEAVGRALVALRRGLESVTVDLDEPTVTGLASVVGTRIGSPTEER